MKRYQKRAVVFWSGFLVTAVLNVLVEPEMQGRTAVCATLFAWLALAEMIGGDPK